MHHLRVRQTPITKDDVIAYVCLGCERDTGRAVIATSGTYDPLALRAHEGILLEHVRHYGPDHIVEVIDLLTNQVTITIPETMRLQ